jgi:hypothetical protein
MLSANVNECKPLGLGHRLVSEAVAAAGTPLGRVPLGSAGRSPKADVGLAQAHNTAR